MKSIFALPVVPGLILFLSRPVRGRLADPRRGSAISRYWTRRESQNEIPGRPESLGYPSRSTKCLRHRNIIPLLAGRDIRRLVTGPEMRYAGRSFA
jgi:hypothetical protein